MSFMEIPRKKKARNFFCFSPLLPKKNENFLPFKSALNFEEELVF